MISGAVSLTWDPYATLLVWYRTAMLSFLVLCVAFTAPAIDFIWLTGGHATLDQAALHEHEESLGFEHHHGVDEGAHEEAPAPDLRYHHALMVPGAPGLSPATGASLLPTDYVQAWVSTVLMGAPSALCPSLTTAYRLFSQQASPAPPHGPPRTS